MDNFSINISDFFEFLDETIRVQRDSFINQFEEEMDEIGDKFNATVLFTEELEFDPKNKETVFEVVLEIDDNEVIFNIIGQFLRRSDEFVFTWEPDSNTNVKKLEKQLIPIFQLMEREVKI